MGVVMLSQNDLRQKFRMVPGQRSVMYYPMQPVGTPFQVDGARLQPVSKPNELLAAGVRLSAESKLWILPAANMGTTEPKPGDRIDDGQTTWVVGDDAQGMICDSTVEFKLVCTKAA